MRHKSRIPATGKLEKAMMEASRQLGSRTDAKELRQKRVQKAAFFKHMETCKSCSMRYAMAQEMHESHDPREVIERLIRGVSEPEHQPVFH